MTSIVFLIFFKGTVIFLYQDILDTKRISDVQRLLSLQYLSLMGNLLMGEHLTAVDETADLRLV